MKNAESIEKYMTAAPHTIGADIPLKTAQAMMSKYRFRHLPVQRAGKLVGVISDRDLKLALSFGDLASHKVSEIMTDDPYAVEPETSLSEVVSRMAEEKYGCAIITQKSGKVIGIFTATDGLELFGKILDSQRRKVA